MTESSKKRNKSDGGLSREEMKKKGKILLQGRRYKFKNFNDRIEEIDISSIQRIGGYRGPGPQSTDSTWFELSLDAWKELNCSAAFAKFCWAVTPLTGTLAKLLFNRKKIVEEIFTVLRVAHAEGPEGSTRLALVPVLSLTAMLAKDLGSEFQEDFAEFFRLLVPILPSSADPEVIEAAFASLLYVFKCLLSNLLSDLPGTFDLVLKPLLGVEKRKSGHLRRFGAQCFGYLLRKTVRISDSGLFEALETSEQKEFVTDTLVAAILDDSTGRFRTCLKPLLLEIFGYVRKSSNPFWMDILRFLSVKLLDETDLSTNAPLWKIYIQLLEEESCEVHLMECLRNVLIDSIAFRRGTRTQLHAALIPLSSKLDSLELTAYLLRSMNLEVTLQNRQSILRSLETVLKGRFENLLVLSRFLVKINWSHYDLILAGLVSSFVLSKDYRDESLLELLELLLGKYFNAIDSLKPALPLILESLTKLVLASNLSALKLVTEYFSDKIPAEVVDFASKLFLELFNATGDDEFYCEKLRLCCEIVSIKNSGSIEEALSVDVLIQFVKSGKIRFPEQLRAVKVVLVGRSLSNEQIDELIEALLPALRSSNESWRQEAINLLQLCDSTSILLELLVKIENVPADLENYREKLLQLKKLEHLPELKNPNANDLRGAKLILNFLLGFMQVKLSLLWTEASRIAARYIKAYPESFSLLLTEIFENTNSSNIVHASSIDVSSSSIDLNNYEIDIDDEALNRLKNIRAQALEGEKNIDCFKNKDSGSIVDYQSLISVILKLFAGHPEETLNVLPEFRESVFIPLIIRVFSSSCSISATLRSSTAIQGNLIQVLQALAGTKIDPSSPRAQFTSDQLEVVLLKFLSHGDLQLQNRALDALLNTKKYGGALSSQWKGRLRALLNDNLFREELTALTAESDALARVVHWKGLLAPLIIRILFGRFIARKGSAAGRHSLPLRRKMIMGCFGTWDQSSLTLIVDFLIGNISSSSSVASVDQGDKNNLGFLNLLGDVFASLGRKLSDEAMDRLIENLLQIASTEEEELEENIEEELEENIEEVEEMEDITTEDIIDTTLTTATTLKPYSPSSPSNRRMRQVAMKRILQLFKMFESSALARLEPFLPRLFDTILNPRINKLPTQYTQSTTSSSLLDIIVCMGEGLNEGDLLMILTKWSPGLWKNAVEAFSSDSTKPLILSQLLSFFEGVICSGSGSSKRTITSTTSSSDELLKAIVVPGMAPLLDAFDSKLKKKTALADPRMIFRIVALVQTLAPHVSSSETAARLCKTFEALLRIRTVNESIRTHLITALIDLVRTSNNSDSSIILDSYSFFEIVSTQWNVIKSRPGRDALCRLFDCFADLERERLPDLGFISGVLRDLNSWLPGKISEPDFDLRLAAFARLRRAIDGDTFDGNTPNLLVALYTPIAHLMVYSLNDRDELSIRNQSFGVLKALITRIKLLDQHDMTNETLNVNVVEDETEELEESEDVIEELYNSTNEDFLNTPSRNNRIFNLVQMILLPAVKSGLKSRDEVIRIEFVAILDLLIAAFPDRAPFSSLYSLIHARNDNDDDEDMEEDENIFKNIYHIQEPRRNRAIRQIGEMAIQGKLKGLTRVTIEDLLLPLVISTTLPDPNSDAASDFVVSEAMQKDSLSTCGALLAQLPWRAFLRKLIQYVREITENKKSEQWNKAVLRLLPAMISQFKQQQNDNEDEIEEFAKRVNEDVLPKMFRLLHKSESASSGTATAAAIKPSKTSSSGAMASDKISVKQSLRVPIAISIGQLIKIVSRGRLDSPVVLSHLPKLLTDLLTVLKQKDSDTRDVARGALVRIMGTFGPAYLPFFLREARTILNRGYQRHVLTFTAHAVLLEFLKRQREDELNCPSLDASADLLVDMALASTFGFQAAERSAIEWSGKQPEVRAAKGPEIIALTVQFTSQSVLENCIFRRIIQIASLDLTTAGDGVSNTRGTGATDEKSESLERIEGESFDSVLRALFVNGLYPLIAKERTDRLPLMLAQMHGILERPTDAGSRSHMHRLHSRAFEFISHCLNSRDNDNIIDQLIAPFVPLCRDYILEKGKHTVALTAAINLFNQFINLKSLHPFAGDLQGLLQKLFTFILKGSSGNPEAAAQLSAAFKLTSTLIRDWPDLQVTDTQIKALIEYTRLQLDNPHHQSLTFSLIRSLISRQVVLLQLFELMATVRTVMLTSHQAGTRQQCRAVYIHFLTAYPMATRKLEDELDFLLVNVRYEFPTGRQSCIEAMACLLPKLPLEVIDGIAEAWFLALAAQIAKETEAEVLQAILTTSHVLFNRLPPGKRKDNLELLLIRWITASPKLSVQRAAWKLFAPLLSSVSNPCLNELLIKSVDLISDESIDSEFLEMLLHILTESVNQKLSNNKNDRLIKEASASRFFTSETPFDTRHSIALLWNALLG